jgi:hypothetical protein
MRSPWTKTCPGSRVGSKLVSSHSSNTIRLQAASTVKGAISFWLHFLCNHVDLLAKILTVGLGHELCDRLQAIGTTYSLCHNRQGGCSTYLSQKLKLNLFTIFGIAV